MLLCLIVPLNTKAQSDFKDGFIITNKQDTVYGLINIRRSNFDECVFKKSLDSDPETYKPREIHSYRIINGKYYISMTVPIRNSDVILQDIIFDQQNRDGKIQNVRFKDSTITQKNLFAEYLLDGIVKMYFVKDNGSHYFVQSPNNRLVELKKDKIETKHNGVLYAVNERDSYKGVLLSIVGNEPSLKSRISNMSFEHRDIIDIGKKYHELTCKNGKCIVYQKNITPLILDYGILIGAQKPFLKNSEDILDDAYNKADFTSTPSLEIGVELRLNNLIPDHESFSLKFAAEYWRNQFKDNSYHPYYDYREETFNYSFSNIKIDIDGVLKLSPKLEHLFIEAGFSMCFNFANKYSLSKSTSSTEVVDTFNLLKIGFNGALGYEHPIGKKGNLLSFKVGHTQFSGFSTIGLFVGYSFSTKK
jgi:hypothetical protein